MNELPISPEAREAVAIRIADEVSRIIDLPLHQFSEGTQDRIVRAVSQHLKIAINTTTEKLRKENDEFRSYIKLPMFVPESYDSLFNQRDTLLARVKELEKALAFIQTQIGIGQVDKALTRILDTTLNALNKEKGNF